MTSFETELIQTRYGPMHVLVEDLWVSESLRLYGEWCQLELEVLEKVLETIGEVEIVEGGGFIGDHTIPLSKLAKKLHVFEPVQEIREVLERNLEMNKVQNVEVYPYALGPHDKTVSYNVGSLKDCITSTQMQKDLEGEYQTEMRRLDGFNLSPGLVKLDVEGCELAALIGAQDTLKRHAPVLFVEESPGQPGYEQIYNLWSYYHYWTFNLPVWREGNWKQCQTNPYGDAVSSMGLVLPLFGENGRRMFDKIHKFDGEDKGFFDPTVAGRLGVEVTGDC